MKKKIILSAVALSAICVLSASAQDGNPDVGSRSRQVYEEVLVEEKEPESEKIYSVVEQQASFPGGDAALIKYISDNLQYPAAAIEKGVQGRVIVQFVVRKDGSIGKVKILRGKDPDLDKEAQRVVRSLPNFSPGKMNGQVVNSWFTVPVTFRLPEGQ